MNKQWITIIICVIIAIISFSLAKRTKNPEHAVLSGIEDSIANNELKMFYRLRQEGLVDANNIIQFENDSIEIKELREEADKIWNSIPEGAVIKRGNNPAGKNKDVEKLRHEANEKEEDMLIHQRNIGGTKGSLLRDGPYEKLWLENIRLYEQVKVLQNRHPWYYNTGWGKFIKVIHVLLLITGGICVAVGISSISTLMKI